MAPDQLFELRRRTFDTPQFRGIEFIEVEAKSIVNPVPGNYLPFNWTINPYRGCSHACTYCMAGDTLILMADGRTKALGQIRPGDEVYGTVRRDDYRRYVPTPVLAHWETTKPAYRVVLGDGTELVTSADHRLLSDRGWKYVTGRECGRNRRPHLTINNKLMGTGGFAAPPDQDADYRLGYLCGLIRGDGHLGSYEYSRAGRLNGDVHRFRLALCDGEALLRAQLYLSDLGVMTKSFVFLEAGTRHRRIDAIRTSAKAAVVAIGEFVRWPATPTASWRKGFLAGIYDAEGSYSGGIVRIANTDTTIISMVTTCLDRFGFPHVVEGPHGDSGVFYVRLREGLREHLRFFHTVDPAITRKRTIDGRAIKGKVPLEVVSIEPLGIELPFYDMTTGTGDFIANGVVSHNCFARVTHTYMDMDAGKDFDSKIVVKVNAPDLLRVKLRSKSWKGEHIAMGTATDPYQRAEGRYRLMQGIIQALTDHHNPFSILTKGTLLMRDLDLLLGAAEVTQVSTAFSIPTLDEAAWRKSEPGTPHPLKRMEAVARLNASGIPSGVMLAPILPGITDDLGGMKRVVDAAVAAEATHVTPIFLHLRPVVREEYMGWLQEEFPELVVDYEQLYQRSAYGPKEERNKLSRTVGTLLDEAGFERKSTPRRGVTPKRSVSSAPNEQLSLL